MIDMSASPGNFYRIANNPLLDLPVGATGWTVGCWAWWHTDPTGSTTGNLLGVGSYATNLSFNLIYAKDSNSFLGGPNRIRWQPRGQTSTTITVTDLNGGLPYFIAAGYNPTGSFLHVCEQGGTVQTVTASHGVGATDLTGDMFIGARPDQSANHAFDHWMGHVFLTHRTVSADEVQSIADGGPVGPVNRGEPGMYFPLREDTGAGQIDVWGSYSVTRAGSSTTAPEPPELFADADLFVAPGVAPTVPENVYYMVA